jgi:hypothetical protein
MTALVLSLTSAGLAAIEAAGGTSAVTISQLGLTNTAFVVAPTLTALPGEFKRVAAVAGAEAAPNVSHMTAYDTSTDVWAASGFGLYLADGTLLAACTSSAAVITKAAAAFALVSFDVIFEADLASSISFGDPIFTDPPATTETRGLVELATHAEAEAGTDDLRAVTPAGLAAALLPLLLGVDGAGCGLDADKLDGQHGAWYADVVSRLGFTPLAASVYTAADVLAKLLTVGGAGSGLDADKLDGQHGAWYADVVSRLGFTPLAASVYTAADVLAKLLTVGGAGCGLDADKVDGHHASEFLFATDAATYGSNANGSWEKRANGVIEQWGKVTGSFAEGDYSHDFPIAFPDSTKVVVQLTAYNAASSADISEDCWVELGALLTSGSTATGFNLVVQAVSSGHGEHVDGYHWRAIAGA